MGAFFIPDVITGRLRFYCQYFTVGTPVLPGKYWSTFSIKLQYFPHGTGNTEPDLFRSYNGQQEG